MNALGIVMVMWTAALCACGASRPGPGARTKPGFDYLDVRMAAGRYEGLVRVPEHGRTIALSERARMGEDAPRQIEPWSLVVDPAARTFELSGPSGSVTRTLVPVATAERPAGCLAGDTLNRMESFTIDGPIEIAGEQVREPIVIAACPTSDRIRIRERTSANSTSGPEIIFELAR